jgi:chemotaxis protein histidine kinase CheA
VSKSVSGTLGIGSLNHNNRVFSAANVDPSLTTNNVIFRSERIEDAYAQLFGPALEAYNAKQKRSDRKIPNYLEHIRQSKNGEKDFHEIIFQVGDRYDTPIGSTEAETAKQILTDFYNGFTERNPNLRVFNAVLHMDEPAGAPHLHIDFIPFAEGGKRGLAVKNSMRSAMAAQGFDFQPAAADKEKASEPQSREFTQRYGGGRWLDSERAALADELQRHGIKHEEKGIRRGNLSVAEYKACAEIVDKELSLDRSVHVRSRTPTTPQKIAGVKPGEVIVKNSALEALQNSNARLMAQTELHRKAVRAIELDREREREANQRFAKDALDKQALAEQTQAEYLPGTAEKYAELNERYHEASRLNDDLLGDNNELRSELSILTDSFSEQVSLAVEEATEPLKAEIGALQRKVTQLTNSLSRVRDSLSRVCRSLIDTLRAVFTLKYDYEGGARNKYLSDLTPDAERLIDALETDARRTLAPIVSDELIAELDTMGVAKHLAQEMKPRDLDLGR